MSGLTGEYIALDAIAALHYGDGAVSIADQVRKHVSSNRAFLEETILTRETPIYGVNTGFGSLCDTVVPKDQLEQLQLNLVRSHACGLGDPINPDIARLMLLLKVVGLSKGKSGIRVELIDKILEFYNNGITPVIYEQGSLGASGDLAPLAHMSLPLIGEGEVWHDHDIVSTGKDISPITLQAKEGLALLNGTQFMSAHGVWVLMRLEQLGKWADTIAALSLEAYDGRLDAFIEGISAVRPHAGQAVTARNIRSVLNGTELHDDSAYTQDPYSFRCVPQVHGACKDTASYVKQVVETEINSVTDNPLVLDQEGRVVSGGNFHGQPLAMAFDHLAIAIAELGSISERRSYKLLSGTRGLTPFLAENAGLESGYMIAQYSAASVVSQNKQLAVPCSTDTIDSSNGQEDHVSMGANGAVRLVKMVDNLQSLLGVELLLAVRACEIRNRTSGSNLAKLRSTFREHVAAPKGDEVLRTQMVSAAQFIGDHDPESFTGDLQFFS